VADLAIFGACIRLDLTSGVAPHGSPCLSQAIQPRGIGGSGVLV
jgi:hypothetical protein